MQQIYRRTPMQINFIEITLWHGRFPVNLLHIFRTLFPKNTFGRLFLILGCHSGKKKLLTNEKDLQMPGNYRNLLKLSKM